MHEFVGEKYKDIINTKFQIINIYMVYDQIL